MSTPSGLSSRITSYNVCYTKLLRIQLEEVDGEGLAPQGEGLVKEEVLVVERQGLEQAVPRFHRFEQALEHGDGVLGLKLV